VTVTDPDVDRFFMTVEEAVGLVLEAGAMAENGETFVLDMGEPVRIVSLVEAYAAQAGVTGFEVRFTGLRPGEKLNESLFATAESRTPTANERISATEGEPLPDDLDGELAKLFDSASRNEADDVRLLLTRLVPLYNPPAARPSALTGLFDTLYPDDF
jgi:FlaA1/EpsC-like NDP-sugar epimerase